MAVQMLSFWDVAQDSRKVKDVEPDMVADPIYAMPGFDDPEGGDAHEGGEEEGGEEAHEHAAEKGRKEMLMYGHVELPTDNFSWKWGSPNDPPCKDGCAFKDEVFTVDGWNDMCIQHCGEIDELLKAQKGSTLSLAARSQQLALLSRKHAREQKALKMQSLHGHDEHSEHSAEEHAAEPVAEEPSEKKGLNGVVETWWQSPKKLEKKGLNLDSWPMGTEHAMPEQYSDENGVEQVAKGHFFDSLGRNGNLRRAGINVAGNPVAVEEKKGSNDIKGLNVDSWPWNDDANLPKFHETKAQHKARLQGQNLKGVHITGWDHPNWA